MTDLIHIPFRNTEVLAVDVDGRPHVVLKPAFEAVGLDADRQIRNVRSQAWATTAVTAVVAADRKTRQMVTADVRTFLMALARIPEQRVSDDARPLLVAYQAEVADVIEAYWTKGGAINPRATEDQLAAVVSLAERQMAVLNAAKGLVSIDWLATKAKIVASRALGEAPQIEAADLPLYVDDYLGEKHITRPQVVALRSPFGRRLSQAYFDFYGYRPKKVPAEVNGRPREVNVYFGRDRHMFDRVWSEHFSAMFDGLFEASA